MNAIILVSLYITFTLTALACFSILIHSHLFKIKEKTHFKAPVTKICNELSLLNVKSRHTNNLYSKRQIKRFIFNQRWRLLGQRATEDALAVMGSLSVSRTSCSNIRRSDVSVPSAAILKGPSARNLIILESLHRC